MDARFGRLMRAVESVAELDAVEAAQALEAELADAPELIPEAKDLLAAGREGDAFLEPAPPIRRAKSAFEPGAQIGSFEILSPLGEGGMGAVFLARQQEPRRKVALKLMSSTLVSEGALQRFRYEVRALAALRHPNVAQVYETGVHEVRDGPLTREVPWFAMEFVEGARSLVTFAEGAELPLRSRLRLFATVCDAVQHGHQKGIVHRDLKPDNVLVDDEGRCKVIDFGVARVTDPELQLTTLRAGAGEIVGTLPYMSPEQVVGASAEGDVRSDVYALGAMLYQLLTGSLPISVSTNDFITSARRICEEAPQRPSVLSKALKGDLEAIVLKALEKDPVRRYPSAEAFGADIERFLAHEPVRARAPSRLYQLGKFARRNIVLVSAVAAVLLISVAAAVISIRFGLDANESEKRAIARTDEAEGERNRAKALFETMLQRSMGATFQFAPRFHRLPGGAEPTKEFMAATLRDLEALVEQARGDPRARVALAHAYLRFGKAQGNPAQANVRDYKGAIRSYDRAHEIADELLGEDVASRDARRLRASAKTYKAMIVRLYGKLDEALDLFEQAAQDFEALLAEKEDPTVQSLYAFLEYQRAGLYREALGDSEKAAPHSGRAVQLYEAVVAASDQPVHANHLAHSRIVHAQNLVALGESAKAVLLMEMGVAALEEQMHSDPEAHHLKLRLSVARRAQGDVLERAERFGDAEQAFKSSVAQLRALQKVDPTNARLGAQLLTSNERAGRFHLRRMETLSDDVQRKRHGLLALDCFESAREYILSLPKGAVFHKDDIEKLDGHIATIKEIVKAP